MSGLSGNRGDALHGVQLHVAVHAPRMYQQLPGLGGEARWIYSEPLIRFH